MMFLFVALEQVIRALFRATFSQLQHLFRIDLVSRVNYYYDDDVDRLPMLYDVRVVSLIQNHWTANVVFYHLILICLVYALMAKILFYDFHLCLFLDLYCFLTTLFHALL
jgi:hypothetical protein